MSFLPFSHSAGAFFVREGQFIPMEVLCMHITWNWHNRTRAIAGCMVAMCWPLLAMHFVWNLCIPCPVIFQFALNSFKVCEPDLWPDYYLTTARGVHDTNHRFSGRLHKECFVSFLCVALSLCPVLVCYVVMSVSLLLTVLYMFSNCVIKCFIHSIQQKWAPWAAVVTTCMTWCNFLHQFEWSFRKLK